MVTERALSIGDQLWIATALLHREQPERLDFSVEEIVTRLRQEGMSVRPGVATHLSEHAVANKPAHSARLRLLYDTGYGRRRLYRRSDSYHGDREGPTETGGTRTHPSRDDLPDRYLYLLDWYEREYDWRPDWTEERDPILAMVGLGREIWEGIDPDEYVRQLREG